MLVPKSRPLESLSNQREHNKLTVATCSLSVETANTKLLML